MNPETEARAFLAQLDECRWFDLLPAEAREFYLGQVTQRIQEGRNPWEGLVFIDRDDEPDIDDSVRQYASGSWGMFTPTDVEWVCPDEDDDDYDDVVGRLAFSFGGRRYNEQFDKVCGGGGDFVGLLNRALEENGIALRFLNLDYDEAPGDVLFPVIFANPDAFEAAVDRELLPDRYPRL